MTMYGRKEFGALSEYSDFHKTLVSYWQKYVFIIDMT